MTKDVTQRDIELAGCSYIDTLARANFPTLANKQSPMRVVRIALGDRVDRDCSFRSMDCDTRNAAHAALGRASTEMSVLTVDVRRKDYGQIVRRTVRDLPLHTAPVLMALMLALEVDGHDMTSVRGELDALLGLVSSAFGW